jgi:predicted flap endonuclease-1-like 5' DNA nuclease
MKTWTQQYGLVFFLGLIGMAAALAFSMMASGLLWDANSFLSALRLAGIGFMAAGLAMFTALRREEAGKTGLSTLFGFLIVGGIFLLVLGLIFASSGLSQSAGRAGLGFTVAAMLIAMFSQIFVPGHPEPLAKKWPATTVLTRFALQEQEEDHYENHGAVAEAVAHQNDDLTRIEGIGPKLQEILFGADLQTYQLLAEQDPDFLRKVIKKAGFTAPFDPESWPRQAVLAAEGKWDELEKLQGELVAGRTV